MYRTRVSATSLPGYVTAVNRIQRAKTGKERTHRELEVIKTALKGALEVAPVDRQWRNAVLPHALIARYFECDGVPAAAAW